MPERIPALPLSPRQQELLTDEVQEIISYRPHWMVRKGNMIFLGVIIGILALTWMIRYPDIIQANARLAALNPPKLVTAKTEGKLVKMLLQDGDTVGQGAHIGYLESTAVYAEVMSMQQWLNEAIGTSADSSMERLADYPLPLFTGLGGLQQAYQQLQNDWQVVLQTFRNGYFEKKQAALQKDIAYLHAIGQTTKQQQQLQQEDRMMQQQEVEAYEKLAKEKVIAPLELNQYKSRLLSKDQAAGQLDAQLKSNEISILGKYKELLDASRQVADQQQKFRSALLQLKSELEKWVQQYVIVAPDSGTVVFVSTLTENQWISNSQPLLYVQPLQSVYYAEMMAGQKGIGKIKAGQQVILRVEGYPVDEFGYLRATVEHITSIPSRTDSFLLKAALPHGLHTNYNKQLFFRNNLVARAEIITDDRRLANRLMGELRKVWKR